MKTKLSSALVGVAALGWSGGALAQDASSWPVRAQGGTCAISQAFQHPDFGRNTLQVSYDPAAARVTLTASAALADTDGLGDRPELGVLFLENGDEGYDPGWGVRSFTRTRSGEQGVLVTAFEGRRNVEQILRDLSNSRALGLMNRGTAVVGFELQDAAQGIDRLRDCARRVRG